MKLKVELKDVEIVDLGFGDDKFYLAENVMECIKYEELDYSDLDNIKKIGITEEGFAVENKDGSQYEFGYDQTGWYMLEVDEDEDIFEEEVNDPDFDISLEVDDYELDMREGTLKIDKQVFDDFQSNTYIRIHFPDENDEPTLLYKMIFEDDEFIYCEFIEEN